MRPPLTSPTCSWRSLCNSRQPTSPKSAVISSPSGQNPITILTSSSIYSTNTRRFERWARTHGTRSLASVLSFVRPRRRLSPAPTADFTRRRAQGRSRPAGIPPLRHSPAFPGRALTAPSTAPASVARGNWPPDSISAKSLNSPWIISNRWFLINFTPLVTRSTALYYGAHVSHQITTKLTAVEARQTAMPATCHQLMRRRTLALYSHPSAVWWSRYRRACSWHHPRAWASPADPAGYLRRLLSGHAAMNPYRIAQKFS